MKELKRRNFLKLSGLAMVPALLPSFAVNAKSPELSIKNDTPASPLISFTNDGIHYPPDEYLAKLQEISKKDPIKADVYGGGGTVAALQKKFAEITGKEA